MVLARAVAPKGVALPWSEVERTLDAGLAPIPSGARVVVLIPDHTRTLPLPELFPRVVERLAGAASVAFMIALGTHPPLSEERLNALLGISAEERAGRYRHVEILNHAWDDPTAMVSLGTLPQARIREIAGTLWHETLGGDVDVIINRRIPEADHVVILGPTFPHEVVGFSGGAKYFFPGVSGADMINVTHWLGALTGVIDTIGIADTPVRAMIHAATELLATPTTLVALSVDGHDLAAVIVGDVMSAWREAAELANERMITHLATPMKRVLACAPPMYDELWTAGKAMYKLEPALAPGAELIIYAPHLEQVSRVHGRWINEIGYHTLPHFLNQWDRFKHVPLGVLAHSTHVRGAGSWDGAREVPRVQVTLASKLSAEHCADLGLGYQDPASIDIEAWAQREDEGVLLVRKAGERLYRAPRELL
jgi:nickel-dependent lactate racemase